MKTTKHLFFIWLLTVLTLAGCTGGDVKVSSLGLTLEKVSLKQNDSKNNFLEINKDTKLLRFKLTCSEEYSAVELRLKGSSDWLKGSSVRCSQTSSFYSIDLKAIGMTINEGQHNVVEFRFVSEKGYSDAVEMNVVISQFVPTSASAVIQDFSGYVNTTEIKLSVTAQYTFTSGESHDPSEIYITDTSGCSAGGSWQTFQSNPTWTLKKVNDSNTVYVKVRDAGLTESDCVSASTFHDNVAPAASVLSFIGFPAANLTNLNEISLNLLANGDPHEMKISNSPVCLGGDWESYATQKDHWAVATMNSMNAVSVKFRDQAHNESACLPANFTHDNTPPTAPTMTLVLGTNPGQSNPAFQITGLSIGDQFELYGEGTCTTPLMIQTQATTFAFHLGSFTLDGTYQYFVRIRDAATNWLECQGPLYTFKLDRVAPTVVSSGHPTAASNVATWTETFAGGSDVYEYKYKIGTTASTTCSNKSTGYSAWILKSATTTSAMDITALVDGSITLCVYGRDQALNEQATVTSYTWVKNTSSLQSSFVTASLPAAVSNATALNVTVTGYLIDQYKYKVGVAASTDCTSATGYFASWINITTPITASVSAHAHNTALKLCVIGRNSVSLTEQPLSLETKYEFTRDTQPAKVLTVDFPPAGDYLIGDELIIGLNFDEEVVIDPSITGSRSMDIKFNMGNTSKTASYYRKASATKLEFIYRIVSGDTGNFGHSNQLSLPTTGFIKDKAGNALTASSGSIIQNMTGLSVNVENQNTVVNIAWDSSDVFYESSDQFSFRVSIPSAIATDLNFSYFAEIYTLDGVTKTTWSQSDTIPEGQTSKLITISGINNATTDGLRGVAVEVRKLNHGYFGTKTIYGSVIDDETRAISGNVVDFALGFNDACFVTSNGHLYCMGTSSYGELGLGTLAESRSIPQRITSLSGVTKVYGISDDNGYYCAKASDGIYCWGHGAKYATGNGSNLNSATPTKLTGIGSNPDIIKTSDLQVTCSRDSVAGTKCWGDNVAGFTGTGLTTNVTTPTSVVASIANFRKTAEATSGTVSSYARCALISDGNDADGSPALCWGDYSVNGLGGVTTRTPTSLMANQVMDISGVSRGFCAWGNFDTGKLGNEIKCWGNGNTTSFVLGFTSTSYTIPTEISGFDNTSKFIIQSDYGCGVGDYDTNTTGLEIKCWGYNANTGRLGNGTTATSSTTPGPNVGVSVTSPDDVKLGTSSACAKKTDGTLWCWGSGSGFGSVATHVPGASVGFNDFYMGSNYVIVKTSTNGLQCFGSCTTINRIQFPSSGVTKVEITKSGTNICFIANGGFSCTGNNTNSRLNTGVLALNENMSTYSSSEVSKIADDGALCFIFSGLFYNCRAAQQFTLGRPGGTTAFTGLIETRLPASAAKITISPYYNGFVDSLGNLIQNNFSSSSTLVTFGVGPNFVSMNTVKTYSLGLLAILPDAYYPYSTAILSGKISMTLNHANALNNGSYHYCYPVNGSVRCASISSSGYSAGQLGDNTTSTGTAFLFKTVLVDVGQELTEVVETATGSSRSCARTSNNELYCWGSYIDSNGTASAPMARLLIAGVKNVKIDTSGKIYIKKTDNKVYSAAAGTISFTEKFSNVSDFWISAEGACVKKTDNNYYCLPEPSEDLHVFGRYFDVIPFHIY